VAEWRGTVVAVAAAGSAVGSAVVAAAADFGTIAETERYILYGYSYTLIPFLKLTAERFWADVAMLGTGGIYKELDEGKAEGVGQSGTSNEREKVRPPPLQP
jgi:hypothetical protein